MFRCLDFSGRQGRERDVLAAEPSSTDASASAAEPAAEAAPDPTLKGTASLQGAAALKATAALKGSSAGAGLEAWDIHPTEPCTLAATECTYSLPA